MSNYTEKIPFCDSSIECIDDHFGHWKYGYCPTYKKIKGPVFRARDDAMIWIEQKDINDKENIFKTLRFKRNLRRYLMNHHPYLGIAQMIVIWKIFYAGSIKEIVDIKENQIKEKTLKWHITCLNKKLKVKSQKELVLHILSEMIKTNYMDIHFLK